jgi:hypothetical protein
VMQICLKKYGILSNYRKVLVVSYTENLWRPLTFCATCSKIFIREHLSLMLYKLKMARSRRGNVTDVCYSSRTLRFVTRLILEQLLILNTENLLSPLFSINQQMCYSDRLLFDSIAPTCFDVCTSSSGSFLLCLLNYIKTRGDF